MTSIRKPFSNSEKAAVWNKTRGCCSYCNQKLNPFTEFTVDHVVPVSRGGTHELGNLVPCCRSCNSSKSAQDVDSFMSQSIAPEKAIRVAPVDIPDSTGEMLRVSDVAQQLGVHQNTVRNWLRERVICGVLISRQSGYRIPQAEVDRVIRRVARLS